MKLRTLQFHIEQGIHGIFKNGLMSLASIGIVSACIFIVIVSLCLAININSVLSELETDVGVTVFIGEEPTEDQIAQLEAQIKQQPHIKSVTYCSADDALERARDMYGSTVIEGLRDDNPLPRSLEISLDGLKYQKELVTYLEQLQISFENELLQGLDEDTETAEQAEETTLSEETTAAAQDVTQAAAQTEQTAEEVTEQPAEAVTDASLESASEAVVQQETSAADLNEGLSIGDSGYTFRGIEKIRHAEDIASILTTFNTITRIVSIILLVILAVIAVGIIMNTIKLTVFIRKNEINIMKYVGATDWFIRWPFIIEGIIIGLVGAMIPSLITMATYDSLVNLMESKFTMITNILTPVSGMDIFPIVIPIALLAGALLGSVGSISSIRKHLNV